MNEEKRYGVNGSLDMLQLLIRNKATINAKNSVGDTALHYAVYHDKVVEGKMITTKRGMKRSSSFRSNTTYSSIIIFLLAKFLILHGAFRSRKGSEQLTAEEIALRDPLSQCAPLLRKAREVESLLRDLELPSEEPKEVV
jgi:hypothetical protein